MLYPSPSTKSCPDLLLSDLHHDYQRSNSLPILAFSALCSLVFPLSFLPSASLAKKYTANMEKIKQILRPGTDKDEDYAHTANAAHSSGSTDAHAGRADGAGTHADSTGSYEPEKKEHGVLRQLLNPAGDKYDDQAFGPPTGSTSSQGAGLGSSAAGDGGRKPSVVDLDNVDQLRTDPEAKKSEHGVLRQILNPHGLKYDDQAYGTTAKEVGSDGIPEHSGRGSGDLFTKPEAEQKEHGVLRQILNPGGEKYEEARYGTTAVANAPLDTTTSGTPGTIAALPTKIESTEAVEHDHGVLRQLVNPGGDRHDDMRYGKTGVAAEGSEQAADRSFPLAGGATSVGASTLPDRTAHTSGAIGNSDSLQGHNEALGPGVGVAGGAGLAAYEQTLEPKQDVADATYTYSSQHVGGVGGHRDDEKPVEGYLHHTRGPHATDTANMLDPHVPGEFPTASGEDRHNLGNREAAIIGGTGLGTAGVGAAGYETGKHYEQPSQSLPGQPEQPQHHYGRDAAIIGGTGVGAAGLGAAGYEVTRLGHEPPVASTVQPLSSTGQPLGQNTLVPTQAVGGTAPAYNTYAPSASPADSATARPLQDPQHHYGRDAAIAGGGGVIGAGAYEAMQGRGDTGPASKTVGPHDSNIANIVDPRVQPQPEKMKDHTTSGPYQSDTLNKVDPRVKPDSTPQNLRDEPHDDRNAAMAGAAGPGAYETAKKPEHDDLHPYTEHSHSKLHKKADPRGPTGASNVMHERHEHKLQEAREAEAAKAHERADQEKKPSLIQRILHPGQNKHEDDASESSPMSPQDTDTPTSRTHVGNSSY
nr:hypothetical protein CFP56_67349 [Quercus suber]